jgi:hypothetical protein
MLPEDADPKARLSAVRDGGKIAELINGFTEAQKAK